MDGTNDLHVEEYQGSSGTEFFIESAYNLDGIDHPDLGPYTNRQDAIRALDEITVVVCGPTE
jgi:hypothetical protein